MESHNFCELAILELACREPLRGLNYISMRADGEIPVRSLFRGRIDKPVAGWISLENLGTGFRWACPGLV